MVVGRRSAVGGLGMVREGLDHVLIEKTALVYICEAPMSRMSKDFFKAVPGSVPVLFGICLLITPRFSCLTCRFFCPIARLFMPMSRIQLRSSDSIFVIVRSMSLATC